MQYIYTMKGLGKVHPPDAVVLKDIWLSFLPGAKIGVLGLNGSGKSSLLRVMAGEDHEFIGEAFPADGISVGFLPQEPRLDASKASSKATSRKGSRRPRRSSSVRRAEHEARRRDDARGDGQALEEQGRLQDRTTPSTWDIIRSWSRDGRAAVSTARCGRVNTVRR
jgi:ATPase subunit of ABC transporter with duplicated ATPase domains